MSRRRRATVPTLPGWGPITPPASPRPRGAGVARWWWPAMVMVGFLVLFGYVLDHDQAPGRAGPSTRGLLTVALAVVVIVVLTVRRSYGGRVLLATLTEYAIVGVLVASLVALSSPEAPAARRRGREPVRRPQPVQVEAADKPGNAWEWLIDLWRRAGQQTSRADSTPPPPGR
jgi:hypothetical protein